MHSKTFFDEVRKIAESIDVTGIENLARELAALRGRGGRLFFLGVGGSAPNCSHAVNDFRKLCGIEAYSPVDNVADITSGINDDRWDTVFWGLLEISRLSNKDAILVLSVGGVDALRGISPNIVKAVDLASIKGAKVFGIVGKDNGYTAKHGDVVVVIPEVNPAWVTPLSEAFQAVVWHCLVSHPALQIKRTKW